MITVQDSYFRLFEHVWRFGSLEQSRIGTTREILGAQFSYTAGQLFYRPGIARQLGWVEALQVVGAEYGPQMLEASAANLVHPYSIHQAYGIKLAQQLPRIQKQLIQYPLTRRAIAYIGKPEDGYEEEKPCIQTVQFFQRMDHYKNFGLHVHVMARSWDLTHGFIYDTMVLGMLAWAMHRALDLRGSAPKVIITAGSAHIYESDVRVGRRPQYDTWKKRRFSLARMREGGLPWSSVVEWARIELSNWPWENKVPEAIIMED